MAQQTRCTRTAAASGQPLFAGTTAMKQNISIAGAGLLGRLLAYQLSRTGRHCITVFDPAPSAQQADAYRNAGFAAAGMLSPIAELDNARPAVAALGWRSIALWQEIIDRLPGSASAAPARPLFRANGSIMLAHRGDAGAAQRVLNRIQHACQSPDWTGKAPAQAAIQPLSKAQLQQLEPSLKGHAQAWLLPQEGMIDTVAMMQALHENAIATNWRWGQRVTALHTDGSVTLADGSKHLSDLAIDARGVGAKKPGAQEIQTGIQTDGAGEKMAEAAEVNCLCRKHGRAANATRAPHTGTSLTPADKAARTGTRPASATRTAQPVIRGVRGETIWLQLENHGLSRPVRLLHPRHRIYMVPRNTNTIIVGASEIESEDYSPVSLRSAVELMAAAHSVMPELAEARIIKMESNCRPATPDNSPVAQWHNRRLNINGLFRHGWLLAPALVEQALAQRQLLQPAP